MAGADPGRGATTRAPTGIRYPHRSASSSARSTSLAEHVGHSVLCAGLLTTAKPVSTVKDEPMEFATFDDGAGLIEAVLFPDIYRKRGHVLFDQGPFVFRGKVEQEFGAVTLTITSLDRLERLRPRSP